MIAKVKTQWIEKFLISLVALGTRMSKIGSHDSFGHLTHKLWRKEGPRVKLAI